MAKKTRKDYPENWEEIALSIKIRDNWTCQNCGLVFGPDVKKVKNSSGKWQTFGVHHKERNPMNCADENLISLCSACHCRAEWPLIRAEMQKKKNQNQLELF